MTTLNQSPENVNSEYVYTLTDAEARLETLKVLVSTTLDGMPADMQAAELVRLQRRLSLLDGLPETACSILRAWLDVHEYALTEGK